MGFLIEYAQIFSEQSIRLSPGFRATGAGDFSRAASAGAVDAGIESENTITAHHLCDWVGAAISRNFHLACRTSKLTGYS